MITEFARAKINLALHVTARRADGYHLLDSPVCFAAQSGDVLELSPATRTTLAVSGPFAAGLETDDGNLVLRAAAALGERHPGLIPGAALHLEKRLPVASGIGGGSADAAAALRGLLRLADLSVDAAELSGLALGLGADVPVCLAQQACRMQGIGDRLSPLPGFPGFAAVLVNPRKPVSTAAIFRDLALQPGATAFEALPALPGTAEPADWLAWLRTCRNDLEPPACRLEPAIATMLDTLRQLPGCQLARMSGSGATCFALFSTSGEAEAAASALVARQPGWWVQATALV